MFMTPLQKSIAEIEAMRNEKIKTIAEFDGWKIDGSLAYRGMGAVPTHSLPYLTDLNALHRVALDVMDTKGVTDPTITPLLMPYSNAPSTANTPTL